MGALEAVCALGIGGVPGAAAPSPVAPAGAAAAPGDAVGGVVPASVGSGRFGCAASSVMSSILRGPMPERPQDATLTPP
ncbi:hypothetical protein GCM10009541_33250 [Micromonospora gifhornensis]|uniref:Secreted protein n=1 Tax=Micromonospora gifhornensis TaxID=84594 RepID=A0ABQ4IA89_9ACTN|nr:hypothetical protein Vgi01_14900 [Micromonospora gifhornensis]